ncbi:MAG TPA: protein-glutamate O-methyltransferase CheR [Sandaracinaceae bacterium LLY-WYZ-13_1]|nr:protein-glutamate O-methyltransferase CheR [Sandaracinaceae bacterium LLY-WYZ-13_1]
MSILFDSGPTLAPDEFRLLRELINRFCGMDFSDDALYVFERRLRDRVRELGLDDFTQYYHHLRYHPNAKAEIEAAVDALVTNETYFFREDYQLRAFRQEILPELRERLDKENRRNLTIWSAGCSTGEEVYTLAILVDDSGLFDGWDVRIFGNDISRRVLAVARRAHYGPSSFRAMPRRYLRYFADDAEGRQVVPHIRAMCHFGHLNLLDHDRSALIGRADAVFCRNVLIYFDEAARRRVIDTFYQRLHPGGYLLLGHSESLLNSTTAFELVHLSTDMVYRRPLPPPVMSHEPEER